MSSGIRHRLATEISFCQIGHLGHRYDCRRRAPRAALLPAASFLGSFRDFHEPFLNELRPPRHGIRVDLDSGKHVFVSPVVNLRRRATQLKVHTAVHQVRDKVFVRIAGCHIPFVVVRLVVQRHVARIRVKDRDHLSLGIPVGDVVLDELKVEDRSRQIPFERQGRDTKDSLNKYVFDP